MAVFAVGFLLLLAMAGYSDASYCTCNSGASDSVLQKNIDYACGAGADCTQIQQGGACFNPNTVRDHCSYAVNSYYQRKGQTAMACDFQGTATVTQTPPSTSTSTCVYPQGSSTGTPGTPTTGTPGTPTTGTPTTPTTGTPATPSTGTGTPMAGGTPTTGTPNMGGTTVPGGASTTPSFGLGPTASGFPSTDNSAGVKLVAQNMPFTLVSISVILISGFICPRI